MEIRILVADPYPAVVKGIETAIRQEANFVLAGTAGNHTQATRKIRRLRPDMAIIGFPPQSCKPNILNILRNEGIATRVLILASGFEGEDVYRAIIAGAKGYLSKCDSMQTIFEAVRQAHLGKVTLSCEAQTALQKYLRQRAESGTPIADEKQLLTEREFLILHYTAQGISITQISRLLHISVSTVKHHRQTLFSKLGAVNAPAAVYEATRRNIL